MSARLSGASESVCCIGCGEKQTLIAQVVFKEPVNSLRYRDSQPSICPYCLEAAWQLWIKSQLGVTDNLVHGPL